MTNRVGDAKGFCDWDMATMKEGVGSSRFFMLATGTPARVRRFPLAVICMPAFPAVIAIRPLLTGNETQTSILRLKFFYVDLREIK
jgi:hypothetical protein